MLFIKKKRSVLRYHSLPIVGKVSSHVSKSIVSQFDLSLAYSPGVSI